jgi:hypothetical protein
MRVVLPPRLGRPPEASDHPSWSVPFGGGNPTDSSGCSKWRTSAEELASRVPDPWPFSILAMVSRTDWGNHHWQFPNSSGSNHLQHLDRDFDPGSIRSNSNATPEEWVRTGGKMSFNSDLFLESRATGLGGGFFPAQSCCRSCTKGGRFARSLQPKSIQVRKGQQPYLLPHLNLPSLVPGLLITGIFGSRFINAELTRSYGDI